MTPQDDWVLAVSLAQSTDCRQSARRRESKQRPVDRVLADIKVAHHCDQGGGCVSALGSWASISSRFVFPHLAYCCLTVVLLRLFSR